MGLLLSISPPTVRWHPWAKNRALKHLKTPSSTFPSAYRNFLRRLGRGSFGHGVSPYTPGQVPPGAPPSARSVSGSGNRQTLEKTAEPHRFCEA